MKEFVPTIIFTLSGDEDISMVIINNSSLEHLFPWNWDDNIQL